MDKSNISRHEEMMHGDKFYCDICERHVSLYKYKSLEHHKEIKHSKHSCNICGKLFKLKVYLDLHLKNKHSENGEKVEKTVTYYSCGHCDLKTKRRCDLKRHISRKHLNPKPPKQELHRTCETCNKTFSSVSYMNTHVKKGCQGGQILVIF